MHITFLATILHFYIPPKVDLPTPKLAARILLQQLLTDNNGVHNEQNLNLGCLTISGLRSRKEANLSEIGGCKA